MGGCPNTAVLRVCQGKMPLPESMCFSEGLWCLLKLDFCSPIILHVLGALALAFLVLTIPWESLIYPTKQKMARGGWEEARGHERGGGRPPGGRFLRRGVIHHPQGAIAGRVGGEGVSKELTTASDRAPPVREALDAQVEERKEKSLKTPMMAGVSTRAPLPLLLRKPFLELFVNFSCCFLRPFGREPHPSSLYCGGFVFEYFVLPAWVACISM
ncbi:hypothetical protein U1Q18_040130 [Sarracenia purpurea var. burkii]